jgi:hypothetical protein
VTLSRRCVSADITTPVRHHHDISSSALLLMPARRLTGLKTVVFKPDNLAQGLPPSGSYR